MRLFSFAAQGQARIGVLKSAGAREFTDLPSAAPGLPRDMGALIAQPGGLEAARQAVAQAPAAAVKPLTGVRFLPVVPSCRVLPFSRHLIFSPWAPLGSSSGVTSQGPKGPVPSKFLPMVHCAVLR